MMLARIRTDSPSGVSHVAEALRKRGYQVEIVAPDGQVQGFAEIEIAAEVLPAQEALTQAQRLAEKLGCDLLVAPGALDSVHPVRSAPEEPLPVVAPPQSAPVPPAKAVDLELPSRSSAEEAKFPVVVEPHDLGPDWTQRALDQCAIALAKLQGLMGRVPGAARRISSRGWSAACIAGAWVAGKARMGGAKFGVASRNAAASAGSRWGEAREQYARVRAATAARTAQVRERQQAKAAARNRVAVEVLETTAPLQQPSARGWRAALAGAVMAALVIGVGFSVGAGRTPAATPDHASLATRPATPDALKAVVPTISVEAPKPHAARAPSVGVKAARTRHTAEDDDSEQEVIVRHFAPVRSTPAVSADGVHHYSDTDQR